MSQKIRLNATEDVKEFVQAASKCDFDVDISYNRVINVAKAADQYGVKKFILISTDKAVNPTNNHDNFILNISHNFF